jgi:hypothetical protein
MCAINSAVPSGTGLILLILPRTDVLGYFHAVPSGLHRAPGEISGLTAFRTQERAALDFSGRV